MPMRMRNILAALLAVCLLAGLPLSGAVATQADVPADPPAAQADASDETADAPPDSEDEPPAQEEAPVASVELTMMGFDDSSARDWSTSAFFTRMLDKTGVAFTFQQYREYDAYQKAKADVLGGETLPHVLFKADLSPQEELRYAQDGTLIDLAPLLEAHAPNLSALLAEHPAWREAITLPDGKIVALPAITSPERQIVLWVNQWWMEALSLDMPTTPDAFRAMLTAFLNGDPNSNGKRDEIPLMLIGPWEARWLMSFFGLAANDYNVYLDEAGTVRYAPLEPEFALFLAYLRDLQAEGLLGKSAFRTTHAAEEMTEKEVSPLRVGSLLGFGATYSLLDTKYTEQYVALPPMAYDGRITYRDLLGEVWRGTFAITRACPDPAAALRWVDQLYAPEAAILGWAGLEGEDYEVNEDGSWTFLVDEFRSMEQVQNESLITGGASVPGMQPKAFWNSVDIAMERHSVAQSDMVARDARMPMPPLYLAQAAQDEIDALQVTLGRIVDEAIARFATGEIPLDDEQLAAFAQQLREGGADRMLALWQQAIH